MDFFASGSWHLHFVVCMCHKWRNLCSNFSQKILEFKIVITMELPAKCSIIFSSFVNRTKDKEESKEKATTRQNLRQERQKFITTRRKQDT